MNNVPEALLQDCLDFMEQGESIEQILARYPELEAEIRPFLETAVQLATLAPQPSLAAKQKSQKAFLAHTEGLKVAPIQPSPWYRLRQVLLPLVSLGAVLFLFITTAVSVSASAIPGDALYSVKRLVETYRLAQTNDLESAMTLQEQYQQERIREVQALLRTGRSAEVTFEGEVEGIQADNWTVATIKVALDANTKVLGTPQIGEMARVNGQAANGMLVATSIEMLSGSAPTPEPTPTQTPSPTPSASPTVAASEEPTAVATDEPTQTPTTTASPTASPTATMTPSPSPTATPTLTPTAPANDNDDEDNENENEAGDNENENEGNENNENESNDNDDGNDNSGNDNNSNDDNDNSGGGSNDNGNDNDNDNDNDDDDNNNNDDDEDYIERVE